MSEKCNELVNKQSADLEAMAEPGPVSLIDYILVMKAVRRIQRTSARGERQIAAMTERRQQEIRPPHRPCQIDF